MDKLGTVLPTPRHLKINDDYAIRLMADKERIGEKINGVRKVVGDETRYYLTHDTYAVVTSRLKISKFKVLPTGDFWIEYMTTGE